MIKIFFLFDRVMAPPGGQSQINIFGGSEPAAPHRVSQAQQHRNQSNIFGDAPEQKPAPTPVAAAAAPAPAPAQQPKAKAESNSITAPPENPTAPGGGRASTKVMAPPGGKSSINLFG